MTELKTEQMEIASLYKNSVIAVTVWTAIIALSFVWNYMHESDQMFMFHVWSAYK